MKLVKPKRKDIADIHIALSSFEKAWGSVDPLGNYKEAVDPRQLWIMIPLDKKSINVIVQNCVPENYKEKFAPSEPYDEGILHVRVYKYKTGFLSTSWFAKSTVVIGQNDFPLGFISALYQSEIWAKINNIIGFEGEFRETVEQALNQ
jgi:hypothetical protein